MIFTQTTKNIEIQVRPIYSREHSSPKNHLYIWEYEIHISNHASVPVQLLNRYWKIKNAHGEAEEVRGPGVIGLQPIINVGEAFQYRSFTRLNTSTGEMVGIYEMISSDGELIHVNIPVFQLCQPARLVESSLAH